MRVLKAKLMHDPTSLDAVGGSVAVENQRLSHPHEGTGSGIVHLPVLSRGFPVSRCCGPVGSKARGVLAVPEAEEVPLT